MKPIPIENLYYLLLYAWDVHPEAGPSAAGAAGETNLINLFSRLLASEADKLLRRGLDRGYQLYDEEISGVRGTLKLSDTVKGLTHLRGRAVCSFDDLSHDVVHNAIIKSTVGRLILAPGLDSRLHPPLRDVWRRLGEVTEVPITDRLFGNLRLDRNRRHYRLPLAICRILHDHLLVDETGTLRFRDFSRDHFALAAVFEKFVYHFYDREQSDFDVKRDRFRWAKVIGPTHVRHLLPAMETDVSLVSPGRRVILDTKFTGRLFQIRRGKRSIRSGHLYQLFAYMRNLAELRQNELVGGVLLYPRTGGHVRLRIDLHAHEIRIWTVNLAQPWPNLRAELLSLIAALSSS